MSAEYIAAVTGLVVGLSGIIATIVQNRRTGRSEREGAGRQMAQLLLDESSEYRAELRADLNAVRAQIAEVRVENAGLRAENAQLKVEVARVRAALEGHGIV